MKTSLILLAILMILPSYIIPVEAIKFPMCNPHFPVQVFPIFMTSNEAQGIFGAAGCTCPPLTPLKLYFTDFANGTLIGLPSPSQPFNLVSRADGHFHRTFHLTPGDAKMFGLVRLHADVSGSCSYQYSFAWVRPYCAGICTSDSQGEAPFTYPAWSPDGPPGSFTEFIDAIPNATVGIAHVKIYFVNRQTSGNISGLPSITEPWTAMTFDGGTLMHSFILRSNNGLDTTQYSIDSHTVILETGQNIVFPIWVHKPVVEPCPAGDVTNDGLVGVFDLTAVGAHFETNDTSTDLNHDGIVNILDLSLVASTFGEACQIE